MMIKSLPEEIQKLALQRQSDAGNPPNPEASLGRDSRGGNFNWSSSLEGLNFWSLINAGKYEVFYTKYPKPKASDFKKEEEELFSFFKS